MHLVAGKRCGFSPPIKGGVMGIVIDEGASRHVNDRMDACAPELAVNGFVGVNLRQHHRARRDAADSGLQLVAGVTPGGKLGGVPPAPPGPPGPAPAPLRVSVLLQRLDASIRMSNLALT
jgi:hypothetical protein